MIRLLFWAERPALQEKRLAFLHQSSISWTYGTFFSVHFIVSRPSCELTKRFQFSSSRELLNLLSRRMPGELDLDALRCLQASVILAQYGEYFWTTELERHRAVLGQPLAQLGA